MIQLEITIEQWGVNMNKLKKMFRNDKEALKEIEKLDKKLSDILLLLYNAEDKTNYEIKDLSKAIDLLQKIQRWCKNVFRKEKVVNGFKYYKYVFRKVQLERFRKIKRRNYRKVGVKMTSKELYNLLESMKVEEIKKMINASINYIVWGYGVDFKEFMKDIKKIHKELRKKRG